MRTYLRAKLHGIRVTDKSVRYHGSVAIAEELLEAAGVDPYEQVHVVNLANGNRWTTYAIPAQAGAFSLNGGGAWLGEIGDECVVMTFQTTAGFRGALGVYLDEHNAVRDTIRYGRCESLSSAPM